MNKENSTFFDKVEEVLVPIANVLANQPHMVAVRDAFVTTFPVVLSGTFLLLINAILQNLQIYMLPDAAWLGSLTSLFGRLAGPAVDATTGIMALFTAFMIAYNYAQNAGESGPTAGILSLAGFFVFYAPSFAADHEILGETGVLLKGNLGATGIFSAMLIALVSSSLFVWLNNFEGLRIKMPEQVPPAVATSFSALLPTTIIMLVMVSLNVIFLEINPLGLTEIIKNLISKPLMRLGDSPFTLLVIVFLQTLLWVFGIHGPNTLAAVTQTIYAEIGNANTTFINANMADPMAKWNVPHKFPSAIYDAFGNYGGGGATLGLIIAILLFSKRDDYKTVAKLSAVPGIFNINEPIIFGLPIVLNPIMAIPFILTPVICTGIALLAINFQIVPTPVYAGVWILPGPINAFLQTLDWRALVLGFLLIGVSVLIYTPFVLMANNMVEEEA